MSFPVPLGRETTPLTISLAFLGSTPNLTAKSTDASNFVVVISFIKEHASSKLYNLVLSIFASDNFLFLVNFPILFKLFRGFTTLNIYTHRSRSTSNHFHSRFNCECIQIHHFIFSNCFYLVPRYL